LIELPDLVYNP